eukprot:183031_1
MNCLLSSMMLTLNIIAQTDKHMHFGRKLLNTWPISNWSTLPRVSKAMVAGYDKNNDLIWLIGGYNNPRQLLSFNVSRWNTSDAFTDYGISELPTDVLQYGQSYTQNNDILYILSDTDNTFYEFNLKSHIFLSWTGVNIPFNIYDESSFCVTNIDNYLILTQNHSMNIFNTTSETWLIEKFNPKTIQSRSKHTCNVNLINEYLYVIGGVSENTVEKIYVNDIRNIKSCNWTQITHTLPSPNINGHSVVFDKYIYVFTGINNLINEWNDNIYVIDTNTDTITSYDTLSELIQFPAIIVVKNRIYAFGGQSRWEGDINYWQYYDIPIPTNNPTKNPTNNPTTILETLTSSMMSINQTSFFTSNSQYASTNKSSLLTTLHNPSTNFVGTSTDLSLLVILMSFLIGLITMILVITVITICFCYYKYKIYNKPKENDHNNFKRDKYEHLQQYLDGENNINDNNDEKEGKLEVGIKINEIELESIHVEKKINENDHSSGEELYENIQSQAMLVQNWFKESVKLYDSNDTYYKLFIENGYDNMEIVREMNITDLKNIGIEKIGHQKQILKKIEQLNGTNNKCLN